MTRSPRACRTAEFSKSLHEQLNMYALAAGAAGVGILALTQPAEGKIVYTPTHVVLPFGVYFVDFNHDGINDLAFTKSLTHLTSAVGTNLGIYTPPTVRWVTDSNGHGATGVDDLKAGVQIGNSNSLTSRGTRMAAAFFINGHGMYIGLWGHNGKGVKGRYVGVQFTINGQVHYGWVRFNVTFPHQSLRAVLTGYAYETIPNKPIIAGKIKGQDDVSVQESNTTHAAPTPEPATLGALAMGSLGLAIWKRDPSMAASPDSN